MFMVDKSEFKNWESVFSNPSGITVQTLKAGTITSKLSNIINLKNPLAREMRDGKAVIPVLSHLIKHPGLGYFLVDTGLCSSFNKVPGGSFKGLVKSVYFKNRYVVNNGEGIDEQLGELAIKPKALFLTHAHEHLAGLDSLPSDMLMYCGSGEKDNGVYPLVYSDYLKRHKFNRIDFSSSQNMPLLGRAADVFGDGSFWAISTPGHTKGHISYLVNVKQKPVLLTGDTCPTEKGFMMGIESGSSSDDLVRARKSFLKIKEFTSKYPQVRVVFGHESEEFRISYY